MHSLFLKPRSFTASNFIAMCAEPGTSAVNGERDPGEQAPALADGVSDAAEHNRINENQPGDNGADTPTTDLQSAMARERKRLARKRKREAQRLKRRQNTSVYVTGLPADVTEQELADYFTKCGIILPSAETGLPRVKLYTDENGDFKGDGLVTYAMQPSVENAVTLLDNAPIRPGGTPIGVQAATFDHKQEWDVAGSTDDMKRNQDEGEEGKRHKSSFRPRELVQEALSWAEEGQEVAKTTRIVILKNVFGAKDADYNVIREDMEEGCGACGTVEKITVFERNAEGAIAVKFASLEACVECIKVMNGRWYDGRKLSAEFYDGVSDFRYKETEEEKSEREKRWQEWLEAEGDKTEKDPSVS